MELPPPPPVATPPGGQLPPPPGVLLGTPLDPAPDTGPALVSRLGGAWRWTLGLGWCLVLAGLGALAQAAFLVDADPWWLTFKPIPFALPVAVLLALVSDAKGALALSIAAALVIAALAVVDAIDGNPVVAVGEAVCAASALLLTVAALLGRERPVPPDVPRSVA